MGCPLSFRLLFTYCSWELPEQNRKAVLTPEGTHPHSSGLFLPLSIFPNSNFVLITCKLDGLKCLKISRNTEVQDNILIPWKPSKYGDYLNLEGSWLTFRSASPKVQLQVRFLYGEPKGHKKPWFYRGFLFLLNFKIIKIGKKALSKNFLLREIVHLLTRYTPLRLVVYLLRILSKKIVILLSKFRLC